MNTPLRGHIALCSSLVVVLTIGLPLRAQSAGGHSHGSHGSKTSEFAAASHAVHEAMSGDMSANPHIRMSPMRAASAADSSRATKLVADARVALAKYKNVHVAQREGYKIFAPNVPQPVYHFTQAGAAIRAQFKHDVTRPTSLLYEKGTDGSFRLIGAMFTAPREATWEELNARVPLGIARWHLHTNMCIPRLRETERWREVANGKPVFGPTSPIATREACDAVDGRFLPVVFNWMVHVNLFESDPWADHH
jgi:hypothetical protein